QQEDGIQGPRPTPPAARLRQVWRDGQQCDEGRSHRQPDSFPEGPRPRHRHEHTKRISTGRRENLWKLRFTDGDMALSMKRARLAWALGLTLLAAGISGISAPQQARADAALPAGLNFGLGNDPSGLGWMTSSGVPWRYRYTYLSAGVNTGNGWETWNSPPGQYAAYYMSDSAAHGYIPVFSYYELLQSNPSAGNNESDRDFSNLNNASTMNAYYANFVLLMQTAHTFGGQVIVQVEPDLWGYLEQRANNGSPASLTASVGSSGYAGVAGIPDTAHGFGDALLHLRDVYAPNVALGIHASLWATKRDLATDPDPTLDPNVVADQTAAFLNAAGVGSNPYGSTFDVVFNDGADHDAAWYGGTSHWWD